jgi:ribonucleoside-diphosphate reductase alpha chain
VPASKKPKKAAFLQSYFIAADGPQDPEKYFEWKKFDCEIKDSQGNIFFSMKDVEAPALWSQLAVEIAASKYFRKVGVPKKIGKTGTETSVRQMVRRVVHAITRAGKEQKVLRTQKEAQIFSRELTYILLSQKASFNSPVWFNCGLYQSYGIETDSSHYRWDAQKKKVVPVQGVYKNPQVSACFIQEVKDDLESIFDLLKSEAKLFKFGSGSGTNFSSLRSKYELLSGGGTSSGTMSFLEIFDRGAGSIKSGGTTRRAAKMVCLDADHPEIVEFVEWKSKEEKKAQALIRAGYSADFEGEAYRTVSGQNSNNSVRVTDDFMEAVQEKSPWSLRSRTTGKEVKQIAADELWQKIITSAWVCADPGLQFHDTIQAWHTCPASGEIRASNPCSEYMFLDDSACNLASLNLLAFLDNEGNFDFSAYMHTARVMFIAQEILVDFASYPTATIAQNSHDFRPLGLGFAGLGALLMRQGIAYDSEAGRAWAGVLTALLHGTAYDTSADLAERLGCFVGYKKNKKFFLQILSRHKKAMESVIERHLNEAELPLRLKVLLENLYVQMMSKAKRHGVRNAQATVMAPTGTIGLVMDCDTTGIEPEFSLVKFKKLAGGGKVQMVSASVRPALKKLGYNEEQVLAIENYISQRQTIEGAPFLQDGHLPIFDCAQKNGGEGKRFLRPEAHLHMMAAIQPFLSGAISKTVNLPAEATSADISKIYWQAWELGLKAIAIYRDSSKMSQPLSATEHELRCVECGGPLELAGGCFRCTNCGATTGCIS